MKTAKDFAGRMPKFHQAHSGLPQMDCLRECRNCCPLKDYQHLSAIFFPIDNQDLVLYHSDRHCHRHRQKQCKDSHQGQMLNCRRCGLSQVGYNPAEIILKKDLPNRGCRYQLKISKPGYCHWYRYNRHKNNHYYYSRDEMPCPINPVRRLLK